MSDYDNTNSGALFKNDRKEKPTQPDYRGSWTDAQGNEYWLSAWIKTGKSGDSFMSLSATLKEGQGAAPKKVEMSDIPF